MLVYTGEKSLAHAEVGTSEELKHGWMGKIKNLKGVFVCIIINNT